MNQDYYFGQRLCDKPKNIEQNVTNIVLFCNNNLIGSQTERSNHGNISSNVFRAVLYYWISMLEESVLYFMFSR